MLSLTLGLAAALAWAVHDLLVRRLSQDQPVLPMLALVLGAGAGLLLGPVLLGVDGRTTGAAALGLAVAAGGAFALATGGLYAALARAPVRVVAPVIGAYPVLSLAFAAAGGRSVNRVEVAAVALIVAGIAVVALSGRGAHGATASVRGRWTALGWAAASALGFAATFWLAQEAGRQGGVWTTMLVTRLVALGLVAGLALSTGAALRVPRDRAPVMAGMGLLDAAALGAVTLAAGLPYPEYAAIASSLFGVLTILLAWRLLDETVTAGQGAGVALVFGGIAALGLAG